MSTTYSRAETSERQGQDRRGPDASAVDTAWLVLEAANDLGDEQAVEACRRVIDANLKGASASPADLHLVMDYFR